MRVCKDLFTTWRLRTQIQKQFTTTWRGFTIKPLAIKDAAKVSIFSFRDEFKGQPGRTLLQMQATAAISYRDFMDKGVGFYTIFKDKELIATAAITESKWNTFHKPMPELQFGRVIKPYQGQGIVSHLYRLMLQALFESTPDATVTGHIIVGNAASVRTLEKLGFVAGPAHTYTRKEIPASVIIVGDPTASEFNLTEFTATKDQFLQACSTIEQVAGTACKL